MSDLFSKTTRDGDAGSPACVRSLNTAQTGTTYLLSFLCICWLWSIFLGQLGSSLRWASPNMKPHCYYLTSPRAPGKQGLCSRSQGQRPDFYFYYTLHSRVSPPQVTLSPRGLAGDRAPAARLLALRPGPVQQPSRSLGKWVRTEYPSTDYLASRIQTLRFSLPAGMQVAHLQSASFLLVEIWNSVICLLF